MSQTAFISAQICLRESRFPLLVRKISPEAIFCLLAYFISFRQSFPGSRMVRIFPLREISAFPWSTASTVIYCISLTRMPVAQMVSITRPVRGLYFCAASTSRVYSLRSSSRSGVRNRRRCTRRCFTRQCDQPWSIKNRSSAVSLALTVAEASPRCSSVSFHAPTAALVTGWPLSHWTNCLMLRIYFSTVAQLRSSSSNCLAKA